MQSSTGIISRDTSNKNDDNLVALVHSENKTAAERMAYLAELRQEVLQLDAKLNTMRAKLPSSILARRAIELIPIEGRISQVKLEHARTLKHHKAKVWGVYPFYRGSVGDGAMMSVGQDNMAVLWDVATGLKFEAFAVSRGHTACAAVNPSGRVTVTGGLACTVDVYATSVTINQLQNDNLKPMKFNLELQPRPELKPEPEPEAVETKNFDQQYQRYKPRLRGPYNEGFENGFGGVTGTGEEEFENQKGANGSHGQNSDKYVTTLSGMHDSCILAEKFYSDTHLVSASETAIVYWDVLAGKSLTTVTTSGCASIDVFQSSHSNPLSTSLAAASSEGVVRLYDSRSEGPSIQFTKPDDANGFEKVKFMPDGKTLVASDPFKVYMFDARTNGILQTYETSAYPTAITLSQSGRLLFIGQDDGVALGYDTLLGDRVCLVDIHRDAITGLEIVNEYLVSCSVDGTVKQWSL